MVRQSGRLFMGIMGKRRFIELMNKIKLLFGVIGFLLMLGVGMVLVATNLVDPNDYKPKLEQLVESNTGRQLTLQGDLDLTFYPWLGIRAKTLSLSNRSGFGDTPMLFVEQLNIRLKLLPLLRKKFEIGAITLNKPKIHLLTLADGTTNWDDLLGSGKSSDTSQGDDPASDIFGLAGFAVQGVSLTEAEIVWDDRNTKQIITISDLHLSTGKIQPATPLDIELSARIEGNIIPLPATINFSGAATIDEKLTVINLEDISVALNMSEQPYQLALPALTIDIAQQSVAVPAFTLSRDDVTVSGLINLSNLFVSPTFSGQLNMTAPNFGKILSEQSIEAEYSGQTGEHWLGKMAIKTAFSYLNDTVEMNSFTADMVINGQDTQVDIAFASLNMLRQKLKLPALNIRQGEDKIGADLIGDALFSGAQSMRLSGSLNLHSTDLPNFLERNRLGGVLPKGLIKTITSKMDYALKRGNLLLSSMKTVADEMSLNGNIVFSNLISENNPDNDPDNNLDNTLGEAELTIQQDVQNINLGRILTAWEITDMFAGTGAINLNLTGIDMGAEQPLSNMGGRIVFNLQDGAIQGFDLQATLLKLSNVLNRVTGVPQNEYETDARTKFSELSGKFTGINGHFQSKNISMQAPGLRVKGKGSLDLPNQRIDMSFAVSIVKSVEGQGGKGLENLESLTIPLTVTGNLTAPSYALDVSGLLKQQAMKKVKEVKKTVTEQLLRLLQ